MILQKLILNYGNNYDFFYFKASIINDLSENLTICFSYLLNRKRLFNLFIIIKLQKI